VPQIGCAGHEGGCAYDRCHFSDFAFNAVLCGLNIAGAQKIGVKDIYCQCSRVRSKSPCCLGEECRRYCKRRYILANETLKIPCHNSELVSRSNMMPE
jgi:hypothetical protein